jgi:hypothetical protein
MSSLLNVAACPDEQSREELFLWLWTLKEAVVKARGTGISAAPGLRGFTVGERVTCTRTTLWIHAHYRLHCYLVTPGCAGVHRRTDTGNGCETAETSRLASSGHSSDVDTRPHSDTVPLQLSVTLTCAPLHTWNGDGSSTVRSCAQEGQHCAACPTYHLLLMQPRCAVKSHACMGDRSAWLHCQTLCICIAHQDIGWLWGGAGDTFERCCTVLLVCLCSEEHIAALCVATSPGFKMGPSRLPDMKLGDSVQQRTNNTVTVTLAGLSVCLWQGVPDGLWKEQTVAGTDAPKLGTVRVLASTYSVA